MRDGLPFIPAWFDDMRLTPRQLSIAVHIARRGVCYESARGIAAHCQISRNTVLKELKNLIQKGVICEVENGSSRPCLKLKSPKNAGTGLSQGGTTLSQSTAPQSGTTLSRGGTTLKPSGTTLSQNGSNQIPKGTTPNKGTPIKVKETREGTPLKRTAKNPWVEVEKMEWPKGFRDRKDFGVMFKDWVEFRVRKQKLTQTPTQFFGRQLKKMEKWGVDGAIESISASLEAEWQGLFPPKVQRNGRPQPRQKAIDDLTAADFMA